MIEITNADEIAERCSGLWIDAPFHMIVKDHPGHDMDEYRDAFLCLLKRWLEEDRICLFAPLALRRPQGYSEFATGIGVGRGYSWRWAIPYDEMIAYIKENWPSKVSYDDDPYLDAVFCSETCPGIGWYGVGDNLLPLKSRRRWEDVKGSVLRRDGLRTGDQFLTVFDHLRWVRGEASDLDWIRKAVTKDQTYYLWTLQDRTLIVIPEFFSFHDCDVLISSASVSEPSFTNAAAAISGRKHCPIIDKFGTGIRRPVFTTKDVERRAEDLIDWAKSLDLDSYIEEFRSLPTNSHGLNPLRHLTALALSGDKEKLWDYQTCFANNNRLGFIVYVTKDYVDRALAIAEERRNKRAAAPSC